MIVRIVRMDFDKESVDEFLEIFDLAKSKISNFTGCEHLELHQDVKESNVYFTISHWQSEDDLELYRNSELFKETWAKTKRLFSNKPLAYSLKNPE